METVKEWKISIEFLPPSSLKPYPNNARTHSKHQIRQIAASQVAFGFTNPVLIDSTNTIIAGHARVEAAKLNGMQQVPTIRLENLSPEKIIALGIADNKLALNAGWDISVLSVELQQLSNLDTDFDISVTGFEVAEIDLLLADGDTKPHKDDAFEVEENSIAVTHPGDLWKLGKHRILCGNAIEVASYSTRMGSKRAGVVFVDPPYNVPIRGHVSGNGAIEHREFAMGTELLDTPFSQSSSRRAFRALLSQ